MFELNSEAGDKAFVHYKTFKVADESDSYRLTVGDYQASGAGDAMATSNNMLFSTKDRDNDLYTNRCAQETKGGWWFYKCGHARLTGRDTSSSRFMWKTWTGHEVLSAAEMKIRSKSGRFREMVYCLFSSYHGLHSVSVGKTSLTVSINTLSNGNRGFRFVTFVSFGHTLYLQDGKGGGAFKTMVN